MDSLSRHQIIVFLIQLATLLLTARALGELARRFRQPAVIGEILAGVLLGRTVLGSMAPPLWTWLFSGGSSGTTARQVVTLLSVISLLLVAGLEVELTMIRKQARATLGASLLGMLLPFTSGMAMVWMAPRLCGAADGRPSLVLMLFFGTALAISALPVIAKILIDLNLLKSDMGAMVLAGAMIDDLAGWLVFSVVLGLMNGHGHGPGAIALTVAATLAVAGLALTVGRAAVDRILPWAQRHLSWPGGVLTLTIVVALVAAATTEAIGIHAVFGGFLAGLMIGNSRHIHEHTREIIRQFVTSVFAPIFFASIGLEVNFVAHFQPALVAAVLAVACVGKISGASLGALLGGLTRREALAVGMGLNARGAMEIILGMLALQNGLIGPPMFVALVIMALVTSLISGPSVARLVRRASQCDWLALLQAGTWAGAIDLPGRQAVIERLAEVLAGRTGLAAERIAAAVLEREEVISSGLSHGLAFPHARLDELKRPHLVIARSPAGVGFDALDGKPTRLIVMLLTPPRDQGVQVQLLTTLARSWADPAVRGAALDAENLEQFAAVLERAGAPEADSAVPLPPHRAEPARAATAA